VLAAGAYRRLGKDQQAKAMLQRIVEKYPESPFAAQAAEGLKTQ